LEGYSTALADHGLPMDPALICVGSSISDDPAETMQALLAAKDGPTAVFSSNSRCSVGVVPALQRMGRTDVGLISFGDFPMAQALVPAVTVVDQNPAGLGRFAAERLFRRVDVPGQRLRRHTVLPVSLTVRESCWAPTSASTRRFSGHPAPTAMVGSGGHRSSA
jgi:LacI family transcriptional regulator